MKISKRFFHVNKKLLPMKIHYFLFIGALSILPFRTVFAKQLGISATALGIIYSVIPFLRIITNPLLGFILDYFKRYRLTISLLLVVVAISHLVMILIPPRETLSFRSIKYKNKFQTNIQHSCVLSSEQEERRAIIQSGWAYNDFKDNIFICYINCSKYAITTTENDNTCLQIPSLQFKLINNVSKCKIGIDVTTIEIDNTYDNTQIEFEILNKTSNDCVYICDRSEYQNISEELYSYSQVTTFVTNQNRNSTSEAAGILEGTQKHSSNLTSTNSYKGGNFNCTSEILYKIKIKNKMIKTYCPCKSKFQCVTEYCAPTMSNNDVSSLNSTESESEFLSVQFWSLFTLFAMSSVAFTAVAFMADSVCYEILEDKRDKFGEQRLWGTIGWGTGALVCGYLNQYFSPANEINYTPSFILLLILILFTLIPVYYMKVSNLVFSSNIWKDVCNLLYKADIVYNIIVIYSIGALSGFLWNYQFWFMEEIGASQLLLGLSQTFECLFSEVPWFMVSGWIIKKIGYAHCNSITLISFGARYLYFAFIYDPWMTLPASIFCGSTFALFYASMTAYAKEEAVPGTEGTIQSLMALAYGGLGLATGSFLGGIGTDKLGIRTSFLYSAIISFTLFIINVVMTFTFLRSKRKVQMHDINLK